MLIAACHTYLGNVTWGAGRRPRETVHRRQLARGRFPGEMSCIDWLLAMGSFQRPADLEHYRAGLRKAGFK